MAAWAYWYEGGVCLLLLVQKMVNELEPPKSGGSSDQKKIKGKVIFYYINLCACAHI